MQPSQQHHFMPPGLNADAAADLTKRLQQRLTALLDPSLTLKHVHWNVVGPGFMSVHKMLDDHVNGVRAMSDEVAARIATLGGIANGLPGHIVETRSWDDYPLGRSVVEGHLAALDLVYTGVIRDHRDFIDMSGADDPITEDLLVGQVAKLELYQWFVRAHVENTSGELMSGDATTEVEAAATAATASPLS